MTSDGFPHCIGCGCTEFSPCETDVGPCSWSVIDYDVGLGWCSFCHQGEPIPRLIKLTDFIETVRRGLAS